MNNKLPMSIIERLVDELLYEVSNNYDLRKEHLYKKDLNIKEQVDLPNHLLTKLFKIEKIIILNNQNLDNTNTPKQKM